MRAAKELEFLEDEGIDRMARVYGLVVEGGDGDGEKEKEAMEDGQREKVV